jgi:peptide deformylase
MTVLPIRLLGDPVLKEAGSEVVGFDRSLHRLAEDMLETMYAAPGVGLAAQQVGLTLRFFVFDPGDGSGAGAVANPVLTLLEGEQGEDEGCLSIPGLYFPTKRTMRARVDGRDVDGNAVSLEGEGLLARIFQHETDHVNGTLFIERLGDDERRQAWAAVREGELGGRPGRWRRDDSG